MLLIIIATTTTTIIIIIIIIIISSNNYGDDWNLLITKLVIIWHEDCLSSDVRQFHKVLFFTLRQDS